MPESINYRTAKNNNFAIDYPPVIKQILQSELISSLKSPFRSGL
jgi:hypothetical protein